ncbi:MAG: SspB family protein [Alphaproteobacteria bacterium]
MGKDYMRYDRLVDGALRSVMVVALQRAADKGLPGDHHFYISFRTDHPGVAIGDELKALYPNELTIVLQHQFWGLEMGDKLFSVTLSFNGVRQRLTIPFAAVTAFADPGAKFGLQFDATEARAVGGRASARVDTSARLEAAPAVGEDGDYEQLALESDEKVVALDAFRKK